MHQGGGVVGIIIFLIMGVIYLGLILAMVAGAWKTFVKMGKPGWEGIVPILNIFRAVEVIGKPILWFILCLIPCVNFVIIPMVAIEFAGRFGKGAGFGLGLAFLPFIFLPMLGFGSAKYLGPKPMAA